MDRERIKLLIELSSSVDEADSVVIEAGFKAIREKLAFVKEMFDIKLIGRYSEEPLSDDAIIEMDYYAILSAIICSKWEV